MLYFYSSNSETIFNKVDKLREDISKIKLITDKGEETSLTVSFGIAEYPTNGLTIEQILEKADKALYYSKKNGRNKVTTFNANIDKPLKTE